MPRLPRNRVMEAAKDSFGEEKPIYHVISKFSRDMALAKDVYSQMCMLMSMGRAVLVNEDLLLHSYVLMHTHDHEDVSVDEESERDDVEVIGEYLHRKNNRVTRQYIARQPKLGGGSVFMNRPKVHAKERGEAVLLGICYQHDNPCRAGLVDHPSKWPYSSYNFYAYGKIQHWWERFITPPKEYLDLGDTPEKRQRAFRMISEAYGFATRSLELSKNLEPNHYVIGDPDFIYLFYDKLSELLQDEAARKVMGLDPVEGDESDSSCDDPSGNEEKTAPE